MKIIKILMVSKKRTNKFWFNLKYHYYSGNYKFKIILENNKYFNYALVGKTKMQILITD